MKYCIKNKEKCEYLVQRPDDGSYCRTGKFIPFVASADRGRLISYGTYGDKEAPEWCPKKPKISTFGSIGAKARAPEGSCLADINDEDRGK
jgi:hypothetical protein